MQPLIATSITKQNPLTQPATPAYPFGGGVVAPVAPVGGANPPAPHIVFSGPFGVSGRFNIANEAGKNSVIGGNHNTDQCKLNKGTGILHCNDFSDGNNIPIGKAVCPSKNCQGCGNPAHFVPRHHMRIWQKNGNFQIFVNSDESGGIKRANKTQWTPLPPKTQNPLYDNDEIAVLYVEPPSKIPITFTFHEQ